MSAHEIAYSGYRVMGTTDAVTTCNQCGREGLRSTVVLDAVDREGNNTGDLLYVGSECATRFPGPTGKRRTAVQVRNAARAADTERENLRKDAQSRLDHYQWRTRPIMEVVRDYMRDNSHVNWAEHLRARPGMRMRDVVGERIATWESYLS